VTSARPASIKFILVTLFLDVLGIGLIIPILPKLLGSFYGGDEAATADVYGLYVAAYALMQFCFSPILGSLSDAFGRRTVLLVALFGQGLDYVLMANAPTAGWLLVGRIVAGITGASIGTCTAYIADVTPPEKRAQSFGFIGMAFGLGFIAGPGLGGLLGKVDLRLPFWVASGLVLCNALYGTFVLPESLPPERRRSFSWARANPVGTLLTLKKYPAVLGLVASVFVANLAQRMLESTWVLSSQYRFKWDPAQTGGSLAVVGVGAALVQGLLVRRVVARYGERRTLVGGLLLGALAFALYAVAPTGLFILCVIPLGTLGGIAGPATQGLMSKTVPPTEQGLLQGGVTSLVSITSIIGPPLATRLFSFFIGSNAPFAFPGISFAVGALLMVVSMVLAIRANSGSNVAESSASLPSH
jgi:MFS transporter, DHA1 family, tetracycline resistance protein